MALAWPGAAFLVFLLPLPYQPEGYGCSKARHGCEHLLLQTVGLPAVAEGNVIITATCALGRGRAAVWGNAAYVFALSTAFALLANRPLADKRFCPSPCPSSWSTFCITATSMLQHGSAVKWRAWAGDMGGWLMMPS